MKVTEPRVSTTLTLPASLVARLDEAASADSRSRSNMTAIAIAEMLARRAATAQREGDAP